MQTEAESKDAQTVDGGWVSRCQSIEKWIAAIFGVALCLPITIPWIVLVSGIFLWLAKRCVAAPNPVAPTPGAQDPAADPGAQASRLLRIFLAIKDDFCKTPLSLPIAAFSLVCLVSGLVNGGLRDVSPVLSTLRTFLVYFWGVQVFREQPNLKRAQMTWLLSAAAVAGLLGTFEQLSGFHIGGFQYLQGTGFLSGPMAFAGQMQLFAFLAIGIALTGGMSASAAGPGSAGSGSAGVSPASTSSASASSGSIIASQIWFDGALTATVLGLVFACERSAWLGFVVAVPVVACMVSWRAMAKVLIGGLLVACLVWFTVPAVQTRLTPLVSNWRNDPSMRGRLKVWDTAVSLFLHDGKSIVIGVGPTHFPHVHLDEALVPGIKVKDYLDHAHSNYLQMLATTGILGLISYLWLSFASIQLAWINYRQSIGFDRALGLGIIGGLISLMVAGIFEYNFGTGQVRLTQWFLLSLLAAQPLRNLPGSKQPGSEGAH